MVITLPPRYSALIVAAWVPRHPRVDAFPPSTCSYGIVCNSDPRGLEDIEQLESGMAPIVYPATCHPEVGF